MRTLLHVIYILVYTQMLPAVDGIKRVSVQPNYNKVGGDHRVLVAGATGYIGRQVVKECVRRGIRTCALVRDQNALSTVTAAALKGSQIIECNVLNMEDV